GSSGRSYAASKAWWRSTSAGRSRILAPGCRHPVRAPRDRPRRPQALKAITLRIGDSSRSMPLCWGAAMQREAKMTTTGPSSTPQPIVPDTTMALIVYILYFVGYFTGVTALIGAIMAHVQVDSAEPLLATHYRFQIRTFWIGLLYLVVGVVLSLIVIGAAVLVWWFIWSLIRNIKGVLALNEHRPIADPAS